MINIHKVSKRYEDQLAVDCISLEIKKGEIFGLLGPNGAGKTTLVNMMCGIANIDQGSIHIGGHSIQSSPVQAKSKLGMVPQDLALFDSLTVMQNLKYFGQLFGLKKKALKTALDEALDLSQLEEHKHKKVKKLSGGMKRRLNIACSTLHKPELLILDEPTVGIDPQSRNHIMDVVKKLNQEHQTTIIYITHYMEEVEKLCHRIAIVDHGQLIIEGNKNFIVDSVSDQNIVKVKCHVISEMDRQKLAACEGVRNVQKTESGIEIALKNTIDFMTLTQYLHESKVQIESISIEKPDLEWAFLKLTGHALRDKE